jgi:xylan 1,4-beta-xylosidase
VNAIAAHENHRVSVLVWSYHDVSNQPLPAKIHLRIDGLPKGVSQMLLEHWLVDHDRSNAYTAWQTMGSPQNPSKPQHAYLKAAGQLQLFESPRWAGVDGDSIELAFTQPTQGLSLLDFSW